MPILTHVVNVVIASPGDVAHLRERIPNYFNRWNSKKQSCKLVATMWESSAVPTLGDHPQHILNKQILPDGDLLVAIFWHRIGSPTPTANSGTIEEIREFIKLKGADRVMVYFCDRLPPGKLSDINPSDIQNLQNFKQEMQTQGLYHVFETDEDFEISLLSHLETKVEQLMAGQLSADASANHFSNGDFESYGTSLQEISRRFAEVADKFVEAGGASADVYFDRGAKEFRNVSKSLDSFLLNAWHLAYPQKMAIDQISKKLAKLADESSSYLKKGFNIYWSDAKALSDELSFQLKFIDAANNVGKR